MTDDDVLADRYLIADEALRRRASTGTRCPTGPPPRPAAAGTTSCTGAAPTGGAPGPGAHSHVGGVRWWNVKHPAAYAAALAAGRSPGRGPRAALRRGPPGRADPAGAAAARGLPAARCCAPTGSRPPARALADGLLEPRPVRRGPRRPHRCAAACSPTPWSATWWTERPVRRIVLGHDFRRMAGRGRAVLRYGLRRLLLGLSGRVALLAAGAPGCGSPPARTASAPSGSRSPSRCCWASAG